MKSCAAGLVAFLMVSGYGWTFLVVLNLIAPRACRVGDVRYINNPFDKRAVVITAVKGGFVKFKDDMGREGSRETWLLWRETSSTPSVPSPTEVR